MSIVSKDVTELVGSFIASDRGTVLSNTAKFVVGLELVIAIACRAIMWPSIPGAQCAFLMFNIFGIAIMLLLTPRVASAPVDDAGQRAEELTIFDDPDDAA